MLEKEGALSKLEKDKRNLVLGIYFFSLLNYLDFATTKLGIESGKAFEVNPIGRLVVDNDANFLLMKTAGVIAFFTLMELLRRRYKDSAELNNLVLRTCNVFYALVVLNNVSYLL